MVANRNAVLNHRTASDKATITHNHIAIDPCAGRNMAMITHLSAMLNKCLAINDAISPHLRLGIHEHAVHSNGSGSETRMP